MATTTFLHSTPARSAPGDIFAMPAPAIGADPPKAADIKQGDASVATQTGALTYSYSIQVPPGRNGMAPKLALSYSSQAPVYGGIAAGWSLSIPEIREDTSQGHLRTHSPQVEATQSDPLADDVFVSSLAGGRPLIPVVEPANTDVYKTYRAQNDSSFLRYQRKGTATSPDLAQWRVYSPDGSIMYFGEDIPLKCGNAGDRWSPLTRAVDAFGNEVVYDWSPGVTAGECLIKKISWGRNANAGIAEPFAQVVFNYETNSDANRCAGAYIGSQLDYRTGKEIVTGASRLLSIVATAFPAGAPSSPVHTRTITLGYSSSSEACDGRHAPVRLLTSIQETAAGIDSPAVTLPPITFDYNEPTVDLTATTTSFVPWGVLGSHASSLAWGFRSNDDRWPTVEAMMVDIDGDGLLDRVRSTSTPGTNGQCSAAWQRNLGPGVSSFSADRPIALPRLKWAGPGGSTPAGSSTAATGDPLYEGCSLNGQATAYRNSHENTNTCHAPFPNGSVCHAATDPQDPAKYCSPGGTECPPGAGAVTPATAPFRSYLAYRWMDVDSDGLVDLVAAVHGDIDAYDIEQGNNVGFGPEPLTFGAWPACPSAMDRCRETSHTCIESARNCSSGVCTIDWAALAACMQATRSCAKLIEQPPLIQTPPPPGPGTTVTRAPYSRCEGLYPWFIYKNQGNGVFPSTPVIKYQPVPLESDVGDSGILGSPTAANHAIIDFDGDGVLDAVAHPRTFHGSSSYAPIWDVWLGDGTGGFRPKRYSFPGRSQPFNDISRTGPASPGVDSQQGLIDLNGDGLLDHWVTGLTNGATNANIAFNRATQFHLLAPGVGEVETFQGSSFSVKPGNDTDAIVTDPNPYHPGLPIAAGTTSSRNRVADVDHDGRIDIVLTGSGTPQVFFNVGSQFIAPGVDYPGPTSGLLRNTLGQAEGINVFTWQLKSELFDLDADGLAESTSFPAADQVTRVEHDVATLGPPRLLKAIHNGRGAHTTVSYASMHAPSVVEQHPELTWFDGRPKASPHTQWVVKQLTIHDDFPTLDSTTTYKYKNPRHGADDRGAYSFRGFEEVSTTSASNALSVQRYGYDVDWSGRIVAALVAPDAAAPTKLASIDTTQWTERPLFLGQIKTYHATASEHFTCSNNQTEAQCTSTPAGHTKTVTEQTPVASTLSPGVPLMWADTSSTLQAGATLADGDRQTITTYALFSDATRYRLRPLTSTKQHRVAGAMTTYAKTAKTWDPAFLVALTEETWFDGVDANRAIARAEYDLTTGNLIKKWKPKQNAANTTCTTYTYDARKLFAVGETNELGHRVDHIFEYGTGTKLQTDGPNTRSCTTTCPPPDPIYPVKEQRKTRVDGLGRPIEHWMTTSDNGGIYTLYQTDTIAYTDTATPTTPASVSTSTRLDVSPTSVLKKEKTELDGHGRPIKTTVFAQGSVPSHQVTSFAYRADGTLQSVSVPDPTANDASVVTYTYGFDSLGRPTSIRRPDSATPASQSGVDISYDGVTKTATEVVGAAGGQIGRTETTTDSFGRLIRVRERTQVTPLTWATTTYTYGPDDNVATIVDPESVTTTLAHDFAGHRTQVTRTGGRTWKYTYDKNGNAISEQVPGSSGPVTDALYTTTTAYDDLDRALSRVIGQRGLSAADQAAFASGTEKLTWDVGPNRTGFLRYWQSFAPGATTAAITLDFANDNQGHRVSTTQTLNLAGYTNLIRQSLATYFLFGGVRTETYGDAFIAGGNGTSATYAYDARFLPSQLTLSRGGTPNESLAIQTRNVAGQVTKRRTNTTGAMTFVESNWTYDKLGRVTDQIVQKGPGPTQVVRQTLAYFGNDDPSSLTHYLGTTGKKLDYSYDLRHQLATVSSTTAGYFSATYAYGSAGRFTRATEAQTIAPLPPGTELKPRDVNYVYGGVDPEQVTSLTNATGGATYASYTYDAAGNQLTRSYPPTNESWDYVYDGKDQLRRATKKLGAAIQGSEDYWYDDAGQRIAIIKRDAAGAKTELITFSGDTQAHYSAAGVLTRVYSHLSLGTPFARVERTSNTATSVEYQFHGLASNTIAAVAQTGATNASFVYAPFGEVLETTNVGGAGAGTAAHRRRLNDKHEDDLSALAYYGARYYDKRLIGWTQGDPLYTRVPDAGQRGTPRRSNVYVFALNNPLRYIDLDGKYAQAGGFWTGNNIGDARFQQIVFWGSRGFIIGADFLSPGAMDCGTSPPGVCDPGWMPDVNWPLARASAALMRVTKTHVVLGQLGSVVSPLSRTTTMRYSYPTCEPCNKVVDLVEDLVGDYVLGRAFGWVRWLFVGGVAGTCSTSTCAGEQPFTTEEDPADELQYGLLADKNGNPHHLRYLNRTGTGGGKPGFKKARQVESCGGDCAMGINQGLYRDPRTGAPSAPGLCPDCASKIYERFLGRKPTADDIK